jgi:FlaA1/EpsC-like NDP-sugar epimerase
MAAETVTLRHGSSRFAWGLALMDVSSWSIAVPVAVLLRFDFNVPPQFAFSALAGGVIAGLAYVALASLLRMYTGRYVSGTFDEVLGIGIITGVVSLVGSLVLFVSQTILPRATMVIAGGIAGFTILTVRFILRRLRTARALSRPGNRTLIYGAGDAGSQLASLMQADRGSRFIPIGFMDDDPGKRHLRRANLRVMGSIDDLEKILVSQQVETLVIAIAGVSSARLQEIDRVCTPFGVRVQVIPTAGEIVGGAIRLGDVSDLSEEEIMGRRSVSTNEEQIAHFLAGEVVLITGAGGSIGSELARQVHRYQPARVVLLDRDESALHETQLTIDGSGLLDSTDLVLCDIRDRTRLEQVMAEVRPGIVFHAAALKHLVFLERFPTEGWKTNVEGTRNVVEAARRCGVHHFVNISTDKAADPSCVLGQTKQITERLVARESAAGEAGTWVSVRFGNVLGSRGSVITTFRFQIEKGGPVTVTHPEVSRYFMTVREAVHLVLQAAVVGSSGETLILDMGDPVRIADIARFMVDRSGREIPIIFTGLRPGEKLNEVLISTSEAISSPHHPLIFHTRVEPMSSEDLATPNDDESTFDLLARLTI